MALVSPSWMLIMATSSVRNVITICGTVSAISIGWWVSRARASITGTVRTTVDSDAPSAMLTTGCMRLPSAARSAVRISGLAEIVATTSGARIGGAPVPARPVSSVLAITSDSSPISTMPAAMPVSGGTRPPAGGAAPCEASCAASAVAPCGFCA